MNLDEKLSKNAPQVSAHAKEVATFTMNGVILSCTGFIAFNASGWFAWVLWISFVFLLFKLGADYNKILEREKEQNLPVYKP